MTEHHPIPSGSLFAQPPDDNYLDALFDAANPGVFSAFVTEARAMKDAGFEHYSARTIVEVLRHHSNVRDGSGAFKLNDHSAPQMARRLMRSDSRYVGFFETRERKSA